MKHDLLQPNQIVQGDCREQIPRITADSVALSLWSPPYHVGKGYELQMDYADWLALLRETIRKHFSVIRPGGFLAINIADILCFKDS